MHRFVSSRLSRRKRRLDSFTLVELLTVMVIIAILLGLTFFAAQAIQTQAARSRAASEIQAISTALDNYKNDNGIYPTNSFLLTNTPYSTSDGSTAGGLYQKSSQGLYQALSGKTNFNDLPLVGTRSYMTFKTTQLGNYKAAVGTAGSGSTYIQDPWTYSYGYSTGDTNQPQVVAPYNGSGFFDLWSTGGLLSSTATPNFTNTWIMNWK